MAEQSARQAAGSGPVRFGARVGLVAYGVVHLLVAYLAARVAFGRQERADPAGALETVAVSPYGRALLWLVVGGFAAVVVWRAREAIWGFGHVDERAVQVRKRLLAAGQVVVFGTLAVLAGRIASGSPSGNGGEDVTARALGLPGGQAVVTAVGVGMLVAGGVMVQGGLRMRFAEDTDLDATGPVVRAVVTRAGQVGSVAKGVAVGIVGVLVGIAGVSYRPDRAEGLDAALKTLAAQPYGPVLLMVVAFGLASFGVFAVVDARYHRVAPRARTSRRTSG